MLIDMKGGIAHLDEKLAPIKLDGDQPLEMSDENVEVILKNCDLRIQKLSSFTAPHIDDQTTHQRMLDDGKYEEKLLRKSQSDLRIKLHDKEEQNDDDDDDFEEGMDEDVCTRSVIKHNSSQILEKEQIKNRKRAKTKQ